MKITITVTQDELDEMNLSTDSLEEEVILRLDHHYFPNELSEFNVEVINKDE